MEFRYSKCIRHGSVETPDLWGKVAKHALWQAEGRWKAKGWRITFGSEQYDEYRCSGVISADNYWIFSVDKDKLTWMANGIIE